MTPITLTMLQIKALAEFTGMLVDSAGFDDDYMSSEYVIAACPAIGIKNDGEPGDPDSVSHYELIAYCADCPEDGCIGLGPEIDPPGPQNDVHAAAGGLTQTPLEH